MICCEGDCRQGRDCPLRQVSPPEPLIVRVFVYTIIGIAALILAAAVFATS